MLMPEARIAALCDRTAGLEAWVLGEGSGDEALRHFAGAASAAPPTC